MKDCDENKVFDHSLHPVESGSNDERLSSKRRHLLKGVALGLPAILTLPRGAAAQVLSLVNCKDDYTEQNPAKFNPSGTWLVQDVPVYTWTKGQETQQLYQDKSTSPQWKKYPGGEDPTGDFPNGWTQGTTSQLQPALAYYDASGMCVWYGPNYFGSSVPLATSCYGSVYPGVTRPTQGSACS